MTNKILFLAINDLSNTDVNGKTISEVFSFLEQKDTYCFSITRTNKKIANTNVFCVKENGCLKKSVIKDNHCNPSNVVGKNKNIQRKTKKNPLTCLLRKSMWNLSFCFWKKNYKKWIKNIDPDYIVLNISDFMFLNKLALFTKKVIKKPLIFYNTEDYPFKTWNYLHKEHGFNFLYPLYRKKLLKSYDKVFKKCDLCIHNIDGLKNLYESRYKNTKHITIYHPSLLQGDKNNWNKLKRPFNFYYCGNLDKGRDKVFDSFLKELERTLPESKVIFNGRLKGLFSEKTISNYKNLEYCGFVAYEEIQKMILKPFILLNFASFSEYDAKDKYYCFSTKLSDYIASFNPIFQISPVGEESNYLVKYDLGYVAFTNEEIGLTIQKLVSDLDNNLYNKNRSQTEFFDKFLNSRKVSDQVKKALASIGDLK